MINLGIVTYNVGKDWDLGTLIEVCQKTGFQGVELRTTHAHGVEPNMTYQDRNDVKRRFQEAGIVLWCLGTVCEYHADDPTVVRHNVDESREWLKLAADTGAVGIKVRPNAFVEGISEEFTLQQIANSLIEIGNYAAGFGVKVMVEVHGRGTSDPAHILRFMEMIDHPQVGVTWNCNQIDIVDGSIRQHFEPLGPWVWSVHIHDLYEDYPYHELIALLKQFHFEGFCLIEMPESPEPERLLQYYSLLWREWTK